MPKVVHACKSGTCSPTSSCPVQRHLLQAMTSEARILAIRRALSGGAGANLKAVFFTETFLGGLQKTLADGLNKLMADQGAQLRRALADVFPVAPMFRRWLDTHFYAELQAIPLVEQCRLMGWVCESTSARSARVWSVSSC